MAATEYDQKHFSEDSLEDLGTTKAKDCGDYWLCENIPENSNYRIIGKIHANPQVWAAPGEAIKSRGRGYPKRHKNIEGNDLSVSGNLLEFPLLPGTFEIWTSGEKPGPIRAIYEEEGKEGRKGDRPYDVIYHDPTKKGRLNFTKAKDC